MLVDLSDSTADQVASNSPQHFTLFKFTQHRFIQTPLIQVRVP